MRLRGTSFLSSNSGSGIGVKPVWSTLQCLSITTQPGSMWIELETKSGASSTHSTSMSSAGEDKRRWHCGSGPLRPLTGPRRWRKAGPAGMTQLATFILYSFPNSEATLLQSSLWPDLAQGPLPLGSLLWPLVCPSLSSLSLFHMSLTTYWEALNYTGDHGQGYLT